MFLFNTNAEALRVVPQTQENVSFSTLRSYLLYKTGLFSCVQFLVRASGQMLVHGPCMSPLCMTANDLSQVLHDTAPVSCTA